MEPYIDTKLQTIDTFWKATSKAMKKPHFPNSGARLEF